MRAPCAVSSAALPAAVKECGRSPYHPRMMLKVILYAYMNNIYSCRKIEKLLHRDIHYIWLAGYEKPDFITINRFRNRVKAAGAAVGVRVLCPEASLLQSPVSSSWAKFTRPPPRIPNSIDIVFDR